MGIVDIRRAFEGGLQGKATCLQARMEYREGGKIQHLEFDVSHSGAKTTVADDAPGRANPIDHAKKMAADYIKTIGG